MNELFSQILKNMNGISIVFNFIVMLVVLWLKDKFASKDLETTVSKNESEIVEKHHDFDKRLTTLENKIDNIPSAQEVHELNLQICGLQGDVKQLLEMNKSLTTHMKRTEKQLSLIDQYNREKKS